MVAPTEQTGGAVAPAQPRAQLEQLPLAGGGQLAPAVGKVLATGVRVVGVGQEGGALAVAVDDGGEEEAIASGERGRRVVAGGDIIKVRFETVEQIGGNCTETAGEADNDDDDC